MKKVALILIILFYYVVGNTTMCHNKKYSLLEVLHDVEEYSIFEFLVDSTNETHIGTVSYGKIIKTYKGTPQENIVLITEHQFSPGGYFLLPNARYLIFATYDVFEVSYHAMTCDYYSHPIPPGVECKSWSKDRVLYQEIVKQWKYITDSKFNGYKEYKINNNIIAKGNYKNGKPHGLWHYHNYDQNRERYYLDRRANYKNGVLNGKEERWYDHRFKESVSYFKMGILTSQKRYTITRSERNVLLNKITTSEFKDNLLYKSVWYDTLDNIIGNRSYFKNKMDISILQGSFLETYHGDYEGTSHENSKRYRIKGKLYLGKKVHVWKYYDLKTNEFIKEVDYGNYLFRTDSSVFENFNIKFIGPKILNDKLEGQWSFYNNDILKYTYNFIGGIVEGNSINYETKYKKLIPYKNGKKNGNVFLITNNNDTLYCEKYINNKLDSLQLNYTKNWNIKEVKNFKDGLLNGEVISYEVDKNDTLFYANYINGMLHGKSFRKSLYGNNERGSYYRNHKCGLWDETTMNSDENTEYVIVREKQTGRLSSYVKAELSENDWMYSNYDVLEVKY